MTNQNQPYGSQPYGSQSSYDSQPYGSQGGYGAASDPYASGYAGGMSPQPPQNTMALVALIMSLVGLVTGITAVVGIILGHIAKSQIKRTGESGDTMATWALIVGYVLVGLWVLGVIAYILFFVVMIGIAGAGASAGSYDLVGVLAGLL